MRIYDNIIQGTDEWKEIRHGKIGGSTIGKLMTKLDKSVRECSEYYSLLAEKLEEFDPFIESPVTFAMQRGNELEPEARNEYERLFGVTVRQVGWVEDDGGLIGISPDGIVSDKHNIEIKCPSAHTHMMYVLDNSKFTEEYCWQIVHNFVVMNIEKITCISYRPENLTVPFLSFDVTKDTEIRVSAKIKMQVRALVEMAEKRIKEVEKCIVEDLTKLQQSNEF